MQEKGTITTNQFIWMLFIVITSVPNFLAPEFLILIAERDAWLSVLGGWFMDVMLALVYGYMGIRFAGENFVQYSMTILGKYIGRMVGVIFPMFFLLACSLLMSGLSLMLNTMFLPKTPFEVILITGYILVGYAAKRGVEVNGRTTEILGPIFFLSIGVLTLLSLPNVKMNRLEPQFENGILPFLKGSPYMLTFFGICVMMAMLIPVCNKPERGFIIKFTAVSMGAITIASLVVLSTAVFGFEQVNNMVYPGLTLFRAVNLGQFAERIEVIWMMITVGSAIMASAIMIWAFSLGISQVAGLTTYKPIVYPSILVAIAISITSFDNFMKLADFTHYTFPIIAIFVESGLEILLFVTALILKRRGGAT